MDAGLDGLLTAIQQKEDIKLLLQTYKPERARELLQKSQDGSNYTAATWAIATRNHEALSSILNFVVESKYPLQCPTNETSNLLWVAIQNHNVPQALPTVLEHIVKCSIEINCISHRYTPEEQCVLHFAAKQGRLEVFKSLRSFRDKSFLASKLELKDKSGQTALHIAASQDHLNIVEEILDINPTLTRIEDNDGELPLHRAVQKSQTNAYNTVQALLAKDPSSVELCNKAGHSPYMLAQPFQQQKLGSMIKRINSHDIRIGDLIREQVFRRPKLSYARMRNLLHHGSLGSELFLDLSMFNSPSMNFGVWLEDIEAQEAQFDTHLKVVKLPNLSCSPDRPCERLQYGLQMDTAEEPSPGVRIFKFLREKKKVINVLEVEVPDCIMHPHSNSTIQKCLAKLDVRIVNWRKKDLPLGLFKAFTPNVEQITLYSSGNRDILQSWTNYEGLYQFPKLRSITIILLRGEADEQELLKMRDDCKKTLRGLIKHNHEYMIQPHIYGIDKNLSYEIPALIVPRMKPQCNCSSARFDRRSVKVYLEETLKEPKQELKKVIAKDIKQNPETILTRLEPLLAFLRSCSKDSLRKDCQYIAMKPVKVVVIDTGVSSETISNVVGRSFIETSAAEPWKTSWHIVQNDHGTKMASLIRNISPHCQIIAARTHTGDGPMGVDVQAATEALRWAVSEEVGADIISLSWHQPGPDEKYRSLLDAINKAALKSIIFAATGDNGEAAKESCPARWPNVISICSTNIDGKPSERAEKKHADFQIAGEGLEADVPRYLNSKGTAMVHGSSGATAIAAGLASLILTCVRFAFSEEPALAKQSSSADHERLGIEAAEKLFEDFKLAPKMRTVFQNMCLKEVPHFVQPWKTLDRISARDFSNEKIVKDKLKDILEQLKTH